jgi:hypothetical protein
MIVLEVGLVADKEKGNIRSGGNKREGVRRIRK